MLSPVLGHYGRFTTTHSCAVPWSSFNLQRSTVNFRPLQKSASIRGQFAALFSLLATAFFIDFYLLSLLTLTNPFSSNSFLFSSIQNPGGYPPHLDIFSILHPPFSAFFFVFCRLRTLCPNFKTQLPCFQLDADSFAKTGGVEFAFRRSNLRTFNQSVKR
jgi:hypothetical protein